MCVQLVVDDGGDPFNTNNCEVYVTHEADNLSHHVIKLKIIRSHLFTKAIPHIYAM